MEREPGRAAPGGELPVHRLFGLDLASDFPFSCRLGAGAGPGDLTFTCREPSPPQGGDLAPPCYVSAPFDPAGETVLAFHRLGEHDLLRFTGIADFLLEPGGIVCRPCAEPDERIEILFLGTVLSCWLERAGLPCLHASAVAVEGGAVGFLSASGGGKSTLAASFVAAGHPLLADDVLAVEPAGGGFRGRAGYPQIRLWPAEVARFVGPDARFPAVHPGYAKMRVPVGEPGGFGAFAGEGGLLRGLYLPERRPPGEPGGVAIEPISPRDAVIELVRQSFVAGPAQAAGWQPRRLDLFARLAVAVPVRRLRYPEGLEHLPRVREAVLADLAAAGDRPKPLC